jgi:hypothetical protein
MSSKQISRRKTDFYATEIPFWRTVVWKAVVLRNFSSANVKHVDKTRTPLRTPSVVTFPPPGLSSNTNRGFWSWRRSVVRIVKDSTT